MKTYKTLYKKDVKNNIRIWFMQQQEHKYRTASGIYNSNNIIYSSWSTATARNVGKTNETNPHEQAKLEILSRYTKQLKTGYWESIDDINKQKYIKPILAHDYNKFKKHINFNKNKWVSQIKFNGVCCVFTKDGGYSRKGEKFLTIKHIEDVLKPFFNKFPTAVLHGELFNNDLRQELNKIVSIIRKTKNITSEVLKESKNTIKFYIYDGYFPQIKIDDIIKNNNFNVYSDYLKNTFKTTYNPNEHLTITLNESSPYYLRKTLIDLIINNYNNNNILKHVETTILNSVDDITNEFNNAIKNNDEGIILRKIDMIYEHKRSKNLLKMKPIDSCEVTIINISEGSGNWSNMAKIITVKMDDGKVFDATFKGTQQDAIKCLKNKHKWINKVVTISFNGFTAYGIPQYAQFNYRNCLRLD